MRKQIFTLLLALLTGAAASAQPRTRGLYTARIEINGKDTMQVIDILPVFVFNRPADMRRYAKLVYNLKKVYPIAKHANRLLLQTNKKLEGIKSAGARRKYIREMEEQLKKEYTPILKKMTYSQGKLLIKLIDRETEHTSYELVKDLRGSFSAFFWQSVARLFGANLKDTYDGEGDDKLIEELILRLEAGLL